MFNFLKDSFDREDFAQVAASWWSDKANIVPPEGTLNASIIEIPHVQDLPENHDPSITSKGAEIAQHDSYITPKDPDITQQHPDWWNPPDPFSMPPVTRINPYDPDIVSMNHLKREHEEEVEMTPDEQHGSFHCERTMMKRQQCEQTTAMMRDLRRYKAKLRARNKRRRKCKGDNKEEMLMLRNTRIVKEETSAADESICNQMRNLRIVKGIKPSENDCLTRNLRMPKEDMISEEDVHKKMLNLKI